MTDKFDEEVTSMLTKCVEIVQESLDVMTTNPENHGVKVADLTKLAELSLKLREYQNKNKEPEQKNDNEARKAFNDLSAAFLSLTEEEDGTEGTADTLEEDSEESS
jgi:predicted RNA-binding protein with RPS1 domain